MTADPATQAARLDDMITAALHLIAEGGKPAACAIAVLTVAAKMAGELADALDELEV